MDAARPLPESAGPAVLMVPMHPGIQYHFARCGLPIYLLGHWDQFKYWRPKPTNIINIRRRYSPRHLGYGVDQYARLVARLTGRADEIGAIWMHFPWQLKLFWNDTAVPKIYFVAKEDELSVETWSALLDRSDFTVVSYYRRTTEWAAARFGVELPEIQLGVDPGEYAGWTGEAPLILTVIHSWATRGWRYESYRQATDGLPTLHVDHLDPLKPKVDYQQLIDLFKTSRVYLHDGEREYTIVLIEAMMAGMPIVSFALPGIEDYVVHGSNGFVCRSADEVRDYCRLLLDDHALAGRLGAESRRLALARHHESRWRTDWSSLIRAVVG